MDVMEPIVVEAEHKAQFAKEQDRLLETILNYRFFYPWKSLEKNVNNELSLKMESKLEIYVTPVCNQNCSYCYLKDNHNIYPQDKINPELILHNLKLLFDYILVNNYDIPEIEYFSGEIWHTKLGLDVLDLTIEYLKKGIKLGHVVISSNCYFVNKDETLQKLQQRIDQIKMMTPIEFSLSIDGPLVDNLTRARSNGNKYDDEFYDKVFTFAKHNGFLFHPMLSAASMPYQKENYDWWKKKLKEYNIEGYVMDLAMMLEVRNDDWTDEALKAYNDFLNYILDDYLTDNCNGDVEYFAQQFGFIRNQKNENSFKIGGYIPWEIIEVDSILGCTVTTDLTVRLGDLAICPCHRTAYDHYLYGYFKVENDMITGITAQNPEMAIKILFSNLHTSSPVCNQCYLKDYCEHGCYGSQLEVMKDPFFPIPGVCKLFREKNHTILEYLRKHGVIDYYKTINAQEVESERILKLLKFEQLEREMYKNELGTC